MSNTQKTTVDPVECASFRAVVTAEREWTRERIAHLLSENEKRREDLEKVWLRIFGGVAAFAVSALGMLVAIFKAKVGL